MMNRIAPTLSRTGRGIRLAGFFSILVTAIAGIGPALADAKAEPSSHYVEDAKSYLAKGQLRAAEIQLKNALRANPNDIEARVTLGIVAMREGDAGGAERSFKSALLHGGVRQQILPLLGQSYLMQGKAREVLDELKPDGLASEPAAQIMDLRARAYIFQKRPDDAKKEAEAALALQPDMPEALLTLASLYRQMDNNAEAESLVDRVLKARPTDVVALNAKGNLRTLLNDPRSALDAYGKVLEIHPDDVNAGLGEAAALLALDRVAQARHDVDEVLSRQPNQPGGLYLRALILEREGRYADALAAIEPAAPNLDDAFPAQILLGELNLRANHVDKAQSYAQHALSLAPASLGAKLLLALIYTRREQPGQVVQILEPVAAAFPENAQVEMILGDAYGRLGNFNAAAKALEIAQRQNPADVDLRINLDASRISAGSYDAGTSDLSSLLKTNPRADRASVLLISAAMNRGQLAEAEKLALDLRGAQPTNPLIDALLGRIHWMMGNWNAAEDDFKSALHKKSTFLDAAKKLVLLRRLQGEPDQAESLYGASLVADPKDVQAMVALAGLAQVKGDEQGAVNWLEKASAAAPDSIEIRVRLVDLLIMQKKNKKALAVAQALEQTGHDVPAIVNALAQAQLAAGERDSAVISLRHLAELQPDAAGGQYRLGQALAFLDRPEDALSAYRKAIEIDPGYLLAWRALVAGKAHTAGLNQGLEIAGQAMANSAAAPYGDALKGEAYLAVHRYAEAEAAFLTALNRAPDVRLMMRLADAHAQAGDKAGVIRVLSAWLDAHPHDGGVRGAYAEALMANKDNAAAEREYKALLTLNPVYVPALNNLAWLYSETDPAKALAYGNLAFGLAPESPQVRDTLAWTLLQQNRTGPATILLRMAHAQMPDDPEIGYHLSMALARAGDNNEARALVKPLAQRSIAFSSQDDARQLLHKLGSGN